MILCTFLFLLWLILNGRITVEICLLGLVISVGLYIFCAKALGYDPRREKGLIKRLGLYIVYTFVLIWEILKASVGVMKIVLAPRMHYHPAIVRLEVPLKKEVSRVFLSNSITLTPGTVTVEEHEGEFLVLCLDSANADSMAHWRPVKILMKLEEAAWN